MKALDVNFYCSLLSLGLRPLQRTLCLGSRAHDNLIHFLIILAGWSIVLADLEFHRIFEKLHGKKHGLPRNTSERSQGDRRWSLRPVFVCFNWPKPTVLSSLVMSALEGFLRIPAGKGHFALIETPRVELSPGRDIGHRSVKRALQQLLTEGIGWVDCRVKAWNRTWEGI